MGAIQQILAAGAASDGAVAYRAAGSMTLVASGTGVNMPFPAGMQVGDLIVCVVMRRSTMAPGAGFTLRSSAGPTTNGTTNQWTDVYTKTANSTDISTGSIAFSQVSAGRMIGQAFAIYGTTGTPTLESQSAALDSSNTLATTPIPSISAVASGCLAVVACSNITSKATPTASSMAVDSGYTLISPSSVDQNRCGVAIKSIAAGASTAGTFSSDGGVTNYWTSNALIFKAP